MRKGLACAQHHWLQAAGVVAAASGQLAPCWHAAAAAAEGAVAAAPGKNPSSPTCIAVANLSTAQTASLAAEHAIAL